MLNIGGATTRVYLAVGATDMRKSYDGLYGLVKSRMESDPTSGHLFVFCNAAKTRLKILVFDGSGLWICAKRLSRGCFDWPTDVEGTKVLLTATELAALVDGLQLTQMRAKAWWRKKIAA